MSSSRELPDFSELRVAVVGDLVADHYVHASPRRLSREAPVMVLRFERERIGCGGAANVARNLRALGAQVAMFGVTGRDANGRALVEQLEAEGVDVASVVTSPGWTTPTKSRVLAAEPRRFPQQVLRIDREPDAPVAIEARRRVAEGLRARAAEFAAVVVSDYEYGLVDAELGAAASELAAADTVVVHDPRRPIESLRGLTALTPNVGELARFTGADIATLDGADALRVAARELLDGSQARYLLVTRGNLGMALFGAGLPPEGVAVEASGAGEVTDVSGAGDTAAAVFALALAAGCDAPSAMALANAASGVVVMENGTAVCSTTELRNALAVAPVPARLSGARPA